MSSSQQVTSGAEEILNEFVHRQETLLLERMSGDFLRDAPHQILADVAHAKTLLSASPRAPRRHGTTRLRNRPRDDDRRRRRAPRPTRHGRRHPDLRRISEVEPAVHAIVSRGVWNPDGEWLPIPYVDAHQAELLFRHKLFALLRDRGLISEERIDLLFSWSHSYFSVHNHTAVYPSDTERLHKLACYLLRGE